MRVHLMLLALHASLCFVAVQCSPPTRTFDTCTQLNNYYINKLLPHVGPYMIELWSAFHKSRLVVPPTDADLGRPGGPAGLILTAPTAPPHFVEVGNVTGGGVYDHGNKNNRDDQQNVEEEIEFQGTEEQEKSAEDIIKTDGSTVYTISGSKLSVVKVSGNGAGGTVTGSLRLPTRPDGIMIEGNFVMVIGRDDSYKRPGHVRFDPNPSTGEVSTVLYQIYVGGDRPRLVSTLHLEGAYARVLQTNGIARIVIKFNPLNALWMYDAGDSSSPIPGPTRKQWSRQWNRDIIVSSRPGNWLPTYRLRKGAQQQTGVYAACNTIFFAPRSFSGFSQLYVVTVPLAGVMSPSAVASIMSDADALYVTNTVMYVTTAPLGLTQFTSDEEPRFGRAYRTTLHRFTFSKTSATYKASGSIVGSVINRFALHEYREHLFVVSTAGAEWWNKRLERESRITALKIEGTRTLRPIFSVGNLGLGEHIITVRFRGAIAYVSTYSYTDPRYTVDLSRPWAMVVRGDLKIQGFTSYLHFISSSRILTVGENIIPGVLNSGMKVSLFDVSNETAPAELTSWSLPIFLPVAEWDNHAFIYYGRRRIAVIPIIINNIDYEPWFTGALVLHVSDEKIVEVGRVQHAVPALDYNKRILRNVVIGDFLWSLSSNLLQVNKIGQFAARKRSDALDVSDNIVVRLPSLVGKRIAASYSWKNQFSELYTGTQFLDEKVGRECQTDDSNGKYIRFSGQKSEEDNREEATILIGMALRDGKFKKKAEILFNADWFDWPFQGDATLTIQLEHVSSGEVVPGSRLSIFINPGTNQACSETVVGRLSVVLNNDDVVLTLVN